MLVDYTHLTQSYHHLFPPKNFEECNDHKSGMFGIEGELRE